MTASTTVTRVRQGIAWARRSPPRWWPLTTYSNQSEKRAAVVFRPCHAGVAPALPAAKGFDTCVSPFAAFGRQRCERFDERGNDRLPISPARLAKQPHRRIPGTVAALQEAKIR